MPQAEPLRRSAAPAAEGGAPDARASASEAARAASWVAEARARQLLAPTCRIGRNSARRLAVWRQDRAKRGATSLPVGAALDAAEAEDRAEGPAEGPDRKKAVIYRSY